MQNRETFQENWAEGTDVARVPGRVSPEKKMEATDPVFKISVRLEGEVYPLEGTMDTSVQQLASRVQKATGHRGICKLAYNGAALDAQHLTWAEVGLHPGAVVDVTPALPLTITHFDKPNTLGSCVLNVPWAPSDKLEYLWALVEAHWGIPRERQAVRWGEYYTDGAKTLEEYGVRERACVDLGLRGTVSAVVVVAPHPPLTLKLELTDTLKSLKGTVSEATGVPPETQVVYVGTSRFDRDDLALFNLGLGEDPVPEVRILTRGPIDITVNFKDASIPLTVDATDNVETLMYSLRRTDGVELPPVFSLLLDGQRLDKSRPLASYGVASGAVLACVPAQVVQVAPEWTWSRQEITVIEGDTIGTIKTAVQLEDGNTVSHLVLTPDRECRDGLADSRTLASYIAEGVVGEDAVLFAYLKGPVNITVVLPDGRALPYHTDLAERVSAVKQMVHVACGKAVEDLRLNTKYGSLYDDDSPLSKFGVTEGTVVKVELIYRIPITVVTPDQRIVLKFEPDHAVHSIKMKMRELYNPDLMFDEVKILKEGAEEAGEPEDADSFREVGIVAGDVLIVRFRTKLKFAVPGRDTPLLVPVLLTDAVGLCRAAVAKGARCKPEGLAFSFGGVVLEDSLPFAHYGVGEDSSVDCLVFMTLSLRSLTGKWEEVTGLLPTSTIREVKERYQAKGGPPSERQTLIFAGKPLQDDRTLGDYGIRDQSTLQLLVKA